MSLWRNLVLTLVLAILAAAIGLWGGARYGLARAHRAPALHEMLHERLHLTVEQQRRIFGLESDHAARRLALTAEMRAANADLARAYEEAHAYTPKVQLAIDRLHQAMGALQTETMVHVIAMRSVLRADQTRPFDDTIIRSLTDPDS